MSQPVSRSWNQPLEIPAQKGMFGRMADSISMTFRRIFDSQGVEREFQEQIKAHQAKMHAAAQWDLAQIPVKPAVVSRSSVAKETTDPIEKFFETFFYNIVVSFFEAQLIEQVRNVISGGVSSLIDKEAPNVADFAISKMSTLDFKNPKTRNLINSALDYFLGACRNPEERKAIITKALIDSSITGFDLDKLEKIRTVEGLTEVLGEDKVAPFVQSLMKTLLPEWLKTDRFKGNLNLSIYQNFRPLIDQFLKEAPALAGEMEQFSDISKISPMLKVVARIGSRLVAKRLAFFFKNMNIKDMLDRSIGVARHHVKAHTEAHKASVGEKFPVIRNQKYMTKFTQQEGCHPLLKKGSKNTLTEAFSEDFVDYVLDDSIIKDFVESLGQERDEILKDVTNPFVISFVDELIKKENSEILTNALVTLKPLAVHGLKEAIEDIGFNKIFHGDSIFRLLFENIAPAVVDVIQRVMIKKLVFNKVIETNTENEFIKDLINLYAVYYNSGGAHNLGNPELKVVKQLNNLYIEKVKCRQNDAVLTRLPELIGISLKEFLEPMRKKGLKPEDVDAAKIEAEIKSYFRDEFSQVEKNEYGEFLMTVIFDLPEQNLVVQGANAIGVNKWDILTNIFTSLFLNGVYDLRGVDSAGNPVPGKYPYIEFFNLIEPSLMPYEKPETVRRLFQDAAKPWDESMIKTETEREAKLIADLLYDLIRFSVPYYGVAKTVDWAVWGLDKQLNFVLIELFGRSEVNYNLFYHALEILKDQIVEVKKAEKAAK